MILSGSPLDYIIVFLGGVAVSFTPCIYPFIPLSISIIGAGGAVSKSRGFVLSFLYVTGIAVTYALLGLFASLTGSIFGTISSHPATNIAVGLAIFLFGLSMLEVVKLNFSFPLRPPAFMGGGLLRVFLLGLLSGLVIGPCTTPVLGSILAYLFSRKNIIYGTTLLLAFAYGMGLILMLCGTFGSILSILPKSARWSLYIKKIAGILIVAAGLYFIFSGITRI